MVIIHAEGSMAIVDWRKYLYMIDMHAALARLSQFLGRSTHYNFEEKSYSREHTCETSLCDTCLVALKHDLRISSCALVLRLLDAFCF